MFAMGPMGSYLELARPLNVFIAAVSVLVGGLVSGPLGAGQRILLACLAAGLITAGANAINDVFDVQVDAVNKPHRPLPSGRLRRSQAATFSAVLFGIGLFLSLFLGPEGLSIALVATLLLVLYSAWLKGVLFLGNLTVALVSALAFIFGGLAARGPGAAFVPAGFAFLFHLGREILKDAQDEGGDRLAGARTLPTVVGVPRALLWASLFFCLLILATPVPFLVGHYSLAYLIIVMLGVDLPLVYVMASSHRDRSPGNLGRLSLVLKWDMWVGLVAILVGVWV